MLFGAGWARVINFALLFMCILGKYVHILEGLLFGSMSIVGVDKI
jgi:hypothetical protein